MSDTETVRLLLTEIAPELELEALVEHQQEGETSWDLWMNEARLIQAFLDEESGKVTLSTDLGVPPEENLAGMHRLLLQYNYLWKETSGTRMALEEPSGNAVMLYDVFVSGLNRQLLSNILKNFTAAADAWSALLNRPRTEATGANAEDLATAALADPALFIRV